MEKLILPLSDVQRSYLYGRNKNTFLGGVSTHFYIEYLTCLDREKLEKALNSTIREQPSLRSYITDNGMQCFMEEVPYYTISEVDISDFSEEQKIEELSNIRKVYSNRMFELNKWPMFEFKMYKLSESERILTIDCDMMIMDGLSTELFVDRINKYYDKDEPVNEVPFSAFEDYVREKDEKVKKNYEDDKHFWNKIIDEIPMGPQFEICTNSKEQSFSTCETVIWKNKWHEIKNKLSQIRLLPSVFLTAAYAKLLSRWCCQSKVTLNMTVSNRKSSNKNLNNAIGDFTEVILIDFDFSDGKSLYDKALEAQHKISIRKKKNSVSSSEIIRDYTSRHGCEKSFPFPAVCTCMLFDVAGSKWEWLGERRYQISQTPQVILDNQVSLKDGKLVIHWDYLDSYFTDKKIKEMQEEYCSIIAENTAEVQDKYDKIFMDYNNSFCEREKNTLVRLFKDKAEKFPNKTVVCDSDRSYTYKELDTLSDIIGKYIMKTCPEQPSVIVKMTRHINATAAILGILKSGGFYVPVAHNCPDKRLEFIAEQSDSCLILSDEIVKNILNENEWEESVDFSEPDKTAYVIYTSGSTGNPKGVVITHDAVCNTISDINGKFSVSEKDNFIGISSFSFDLSVYDIFGSLSSGAMLRLAPSAYDMHIVKEIMTNGNVTIWNTVPSIMELLINNISENFINTSLRIVMLSGDWIPLNLPDKIKEHFPNAKIYSLGGATEASIWSIYYPIETISPYWNSIPYGYPLENQSMWVLDDNNNICPCGVRGEICIGGRGVANGYLNDEERTNKQFFIHDKLGYIYRTGDLGMLSKNGWIIFLGRKDFQVKLHGYRIELGEIENCLSQCENVSEAVAEVKNVNGNKKLFAYVTPCQIKEKLPYFNRFISKSIKTEHTILGITTERFEQIQKVLDDISLVIMEKVFSDLGVEGRFTVKDIIEKHSVNTKFEKILTQWADSLCEAGTFARSEGNTYLYKGYNGNYSSGKKMSSLEFEEMKYWESALAFLSSCEENIIDVVTGNLNPLTLLFKDGKSDIADNLYGDNPVARYYNSIAAETVATFVNEFPEKRPVRIIEVGAGVGATTKPILEKLQGTDYTYDYTDLSVFFHDIVREKLEDFKNVKYGILDIDKSVIEQGYKPGSYDLIIAANVIHDSCDTQAALKNLRTLLSNNGAMVIIEVTKSRHFHKISMGLTDGYSAYNDKLRLEQNSPLLNAEQWKNAFKRAGYGEASVVSTGSSFDGGQSVIAAVSDKKYAYPDLDDMYEALKNRVMSYMIPDNIIVLEQFPYTSNKKIDRKSLPVIEVNNIEDAVYEAPETKTEIMLAELISEIIGLDTISSTANLINIGIDSLRGITFITKLQDMGINIGLSELYANPTIRELGNLIDIENDEMEIGEI